MSANPKDLDTKASRCPYVQFEERAGAIYQEMARDFRNNQELSWFWRAMSLAENQHALVLAFCECQQLLDTPSPDQAPEVSHLSETFTRLESQVAGKELTLDEAFLIAGELETSELNATYDRLVRPAQGTPYLIRKKIETLGENHGETLLKAAQKFGVSAPVIERLAELQKRGAN